MAIPALPKRPNQSIGRSWQVNHAERLKWRRWVGLALMGQKPVAPYPLASVTITRFSSSPPDYDGLVASCKIIIDALKFHGVIADDSMKHIKSEYLWEKTKPKQGKVTIVIKPLTIF